MLSATHWLGRVGFEYRIFFYRQAQWKKYSKIFKIRRIQIDELPRTSVSPSKDIEIIYRIYGQIF